MTSQITAYVVYFIILFSVAACQPTLVVSEISPTAPPSETPRPLPTRRPTSERRLIASPEPTDHPTPTITPTRWPFGVTLTDAPPPATLAPVLLTQVALNPGSVVESTREPLLAPPPAGTVNSWLVGRSVEGRPLMAHQFGTGPRVLLLVGGMHGGYEANTVELINTLITHFETNPAAVLPGMRLVLVPVANPDGLARGRGSAGRFNSNGVDLNRNWGCSWSAEAVWRQTPVDSGAGPFSEPETSALADLIRSTRPLVALFYHSAANGVFAGTCGGENGSETMAAVLGEATGYSYGQSFSAYPVTGTAAAWANSVGVAAADVELITTTDPEFERNLRGVLALQRWLTGQ